MAEEFDEDVMFGAGEDMEEEEAAMSSQEDAGSSRGPRYSPDANNEGEVYAASRAGCVFATHVVVLECRNTRRRRQCEISYNGPSDRVAEGNR